MPITVPRGVNGGRHPPPGVDMPQYTGSPSQVQSALCCGLDPGELSSGNWITLGASPVPCFSNSPVLGSQGRVRLDLSLTKPTIRSLRGSNP